MPADPNSADLHTDPVPPHSPIGNPTSFAYPNNVALTTLSPRSTAVTVCRVTPNSSATAVTVNAGTIRFRAERSNFPNRFVSDVDAALIMLPAYPTNPPPVKKNCRIAACTRWRPRTPQTKSRSLTTIITAPRRLADQPLHQPYTN